MQDCNITTTATELWRNILKNIDVYSKFESLFWEEWSEIYPNALLINQNATPQYKIEFLPSLIKICISIVDFPPNINILQEIRMIHKVWLTSKGCIELFKEAFWITWKKIIKLNQTEYKQIWIKIFDIAFNKILDAGSPRVEYDDIFYYSKGKWYKTQARLYESSIHIEKSIGPLTKLKKIDFTYDWTIDDMITNPRVPERSFSFLFENGESTISIYLAFSSEQEKNIWKEKLAHRIQTLELVKQTTPRNKCNADTHNRILNHMKAK
jgi:hypothetical protein